MDEPARRDRPDPSAAREFQGRSVLMLDHLVERHAPHAWPVTELLEEGADPPSTRQHDGSAPTLLPRGEWAAIPTAAAALVDARTGRTLPARVYRLERRRDA